MTLVDLDCVSNFFRTHVATSVSNDSTDRPRQILSVQTNRSGKKHVGRTAAREATAAAGGIVVLTRGGSRGIPACATLRLALPLTLDVSVWPAVVFDQAPLNTVPEPVPCQSNIVW